MDNNKGLSALGYFSVFFAPFLVPIILLFAAKDDDVRYHAKRALISHIIPCILFVFVAIFMIFSFILTTTEPTMSNTSVIIMFLIMGGFTIITFVIFIWNIIQGIKVLR